MIRVRACVHVLSSWLPAHDWEVTVQLLLSMAGPDWEALTGPASLSSCWFWSTAGPATPTRGYVSSELYPHTLHGGIFKLLKWRLKRLMKGDFISLYMSKGQIGETYPRFFIHHVILLLGKLLVHGPCQKPISNYLIFLVHINKGLLISTENLVYLVKCKSSFLLVVSFLYYYAARGIYWKQLVIWWWAYVQCAILLKTKREVEKYDFTIFRSLNEQAVRA